ncbi:MAG: hypothetical protein ACD_75C02481G0003 [uncultured bacterium]|nr:MAG: hypothetical protein ACD_75C02481G0003 [uncultured bacterium]
MPETMPKTKTTWPTTTSVTASSVYILRIPYIPILIITPDMIAEIWLGAAGWAWGSQIWMGTTPAFEPKPRNARKKTSSLASSGMVAKASNAMLPE